MNQKLLNEKYKIVRKIGSGSFGSIFVCISGGRTYALKVEKRDYGLANEYNFYCKMGPSDFIPKVYEFGLIEVDGHIVNGMIMELLGNSLNELFNMSDKKFSIKTVMMLGLIMITRVEHLHFQNIVHRDIKPDNFVFSKDNPHNLLIIDFGLSKEYRNSRYQHVPLRTGKSLTGTARYASINVHSGYEYGRRDDLESIGYCLIYFAKGTLPWQGQVGTKHEKYEKIKNIKQKTTLYELCKDLPTAFLDYMHYVRNLRFDEMPNYIFLKELFTSGMKELCLRFDYKFDWVENLGDEKVQTEIISKINK